MPPVGKELEHQPNLDQTAVREVEGYIERVEKQVESSAQNQNVQTTPIVTQSVPTDMGKVVAAQFAGEEKPKIILPLNQQEIEKGLHQNIYEGLKWLSEWCVLMIKKYPGRVFYLPPNTTQ